MKFINLVIFIGCATFFSQDGISASLQQEMKYPSIDELKFKPIKWVHPVPKRYELNNGMIVYLLEDHELPLIRGGIYIKAGSMYDPADKVGLAEITASTMRSGGTANITSDEMNSKLEYDASRIELSASSTNSYCSFSALEENFDNMLIMLRDVLMRPAFNEDKLSVEIAGMKDNIKRRNDSPIEVAFVNFAKKLRRGHPSGWFPTLESVDRITREDVIEFHKKYYHPNNTILAIAGDFKSDSLLNELNTAFKEWQKAEIKFPEIPDLGETQERKIYYVEKNVAQSTIIMGHLSIYKKDPDLYSLQVGNYVLGGNSSSWLNKKVRDENGLAYVVGSGLNPGYFYKGEFDIFCQTDAKNTVRAIELILNETNRIRDVGPDSTEISNAKESIKNQFVFTFESSWQIVVNAASLEFLNMPRDYYDKYIDNISKVTKKDMLEAFQRKIFPDKIDILVVGKAKDFDKSLSELGTVEEIKLEE